MKLYNPFNYDTLNEPVLLDLALGILIIFIIVGLILSAVYFGVITLIVLPGVAIIRVLYYVFKGK